MRQHSSLGSGSATSSCQHVADIHVLICIEHLMCYAAIVAAIDGKINVT